MARQKVFIISGTQGEGKTTRLKEVVRLLQEKSRNVTGFVAEGSWENNKRSAFTLLNIQSGKSIPLCGNTAQDNWLKSGRFYFNKDAIAMGEKWLEESSISQPDFIVIDEIGIFELENKIWHTAFEKLLKQNDINLIITVRNSILERIIQKYTIKNVEIFSLKNTAHEIAEKIS